MLVAVVFSLLALIYEDPKVLGVILLLNLLVLVFFGVSVKHIRGFKSFIFMCVMLIILQSFFVKGGQPLLEIGKITLLTTEGIIYGISIILRFLILACSGLILFRCSPQELVLALVKMRFPYEVAFMVQVGIRFVPVLFEEMQNIINAIQLRGVDLRKVYKRKVLRIYLNIFSPLVYSVWQKTQKLSILLELRGFRKSPERTYYRDIALKRADYIVMSLTLVITAAFIFWERGIF